MSDKDKKTADKSKDIDFNTFSGINEEFGNIFQEIKNDKSEKINKGENSDDSAQAVPVNTEDSSIRGIFGRVKKKKERSSAPPVTNDPKKKHTSLNLSDSQEILDISSKVKNIQSQTDKIVIVASEEKGSNGMTTITMQIPKLTDDELTRIKKSDRQKLSETPQNSETEVKSEPQAEQNPVESKDEVKADESREKSREYNEPDRIENIGDIFKKPAAEKEKPAATVYTEAPRAEHKERPAATEHHIESPHTEKPAEVGSTAPEDSPENDAPEKESFKSRLSRFFSKAKEKAMYYLGFGDDDDFEDDNIYSTSSEIERVKNANPLDFDEEYKENIVYQAPEEDKKEKKPDLLKVAAQNTEISGVDASETKEYKFVPKKKAETPETELAKAQDSAETPETELAKAQDSAETPETEVAKAQDSAKTPETEVAKAQDSAETHEKSEETSVAKKQQKKRISSADLTLDEIIVAEKMNVPIDNEVSQKNDNADNVILSKKSAETPLSQQLDFSVLSEQVAGDVLESNVSKAHNEINAKATVETAGESTEENVVNAPEESATEATVEAAGESTEESAGNAPEESATEATVEAAGESTEENAGNAPEESATEATVETAGESTEESAVNVPEESATEATVEAAGEATEEKTENITGDENAENTVEEAVAEESAKENIIKIVDKASENEAENPVENQEQFTNPKIIEKEKPLMEYKADFEKSYDEIPKTLLIYKKNTDNDEFVVMAGKFTRTVRSEYRAYRFKPKSSEPAPQANDTLSYLSDGADENPFVNDAVTGSRQKKSDAALEPEEKSPLEGKFPVRKKSLQKADAQSAKSETSENPPKAEASRPANRKTATQMASAPGFKRKKQAPEIMPDLNTDKEPGEARDEKKSEQKSKKKSAARQAIKKKTEKLKLFSDDEDSNNSDGSEIATEKREIDEYRNHDEEKEIRAELSANYHKLQVRLTVVSITLIASIILDILTAVIRETFINMTFGWLLAAFINAAILGVAVTACYIPIINGIVPLKNFKGNSDTAVAFASFAAIIQSFVSFFSPNAFIDGTCHYYTTLVILALLINCIGRMMIVSRVRENFKFITMNRNLYAGKIYTDEKNAKKMYPGAPLNKPLIAYRKKTKFLSDFLKLSYAPDPSENMAAKIAPFTSAMSLLCAVVYAFIAGGVAQGASAFALFAVILTPVCELIAVNLPIKKLCSAVASRGCMVTSFESVKQFCDTNAIIIDSSDLYPSGTVTMSGIKTFSGSKVDDAIRGAAAVMLAVKAPVSNMFENIVQGKRDTLPHVESVIYEDGLGLVGWVSGQRILLGNRRLLDAHGIKVPSADYEKKFTSASKQAIYLSLGGELVAMFVVNYRGDPRIAEELRNLEKNGVVILIRTIDSNITQDRIAEDFGVFYRSVKILPTGLGNITKEMTDTPDEKTRAYIATKGDVKSLARAISGCIRIKSNVTLSIVIQMFSIILGFILVGTITFVSGITRLNILELLIYYAFWIIVTIVAPAVRKP